MISAAAVSFFGCHPVAAKTSAGESPVHARGSRALPVDFVTPNPDVPARVQETAAALKRDFDL